MKNSPIVGLSLTLLLAFASAANAVVGGAESLRQTGKAFASVARAVSPSVVFIQVEGHDYGRSGKGLSIVLPLSIRMNIE